ncbi:MAG TPA: efflux RND transporter periplasmic adaptor subunit [Candidatus Eisenbacteria bacterium]|jgi:Cu(I)/Ag(I) efflux system membrane fusion protein
MSRGWIEKRWAWWVLGGVPVAMLVLAGCQGGRALPANMPMQNVGIWRVSVANSPDPARVGDNTITVVARDTSGKPMHGAVEVVVSMPQMGTMPYMESRSKVKPGGPGIYRASYGLAMGGEWDVAVRLRPTKGPPAEAQYRLSTSIRGLAFAGGTQPPGEPTAGSMPAGTMSSMPADSSAGAVMIDAARRQSLGIRTDKVQVRELSTTLRVPGRVAYDEAHQAEVALKFNGWVRRLSATVTGQPVRRGQLLFMVYSPELWSAQQEYLEATRAARSDQGKATMASSSADLAAAARERLTLWDLSPADIDEIARGDRPLEAIPIRSPASGVITEKNVVQGSAFQAGQVLFRIAQLDPIWVIASVPQRDTPFVRRGMAALIHDPYRSTITRRGLVSFVYPSLDSLTRTAEVRIEVGNREGRLQPGTFVDVELGTPRLETLAVPESAVLPTGERFVVFVDLGDGRLAPREVRLGSRSSGYYEVLAGLKTGEVVVTSGNFLVAAESKLRSAAQKW